MSEENFTLSDLINCIRDGDFDKLCLIIDNNPELINDVVQDMHRLTPLLYAITYAINQQIKIIHILIEYGADVNYKNYLDVSPISAAVHKNNMEIFNILLDAGANVTDECLLTAVNDNNIKFAEMLLHNYQLNINYINRLDRSIILDYFMSPSYGDQIDIEMMQFLVNNGADITLTSPEQETPLMIICSKTNDIKKFYLIFDKLVSLNDNKYIVCNDEEGSNALFYTIFNWTNDKLWRYNFENINMIRNEKKKMILQIITELITHGIDINHRRNNYYNILGFMLNANLDNATLDIIKFLLDNGIVINYEVPSQNLLFQSFAASRKKNGMKLIKLLFEYGADINQKNMDGYTTLMQVIKNGFLIKYNIEIIEYLKDADFDVIGCDGKTAYSILIKILKEYSIEFDPEIGIIEGLELIIKNQN